MRILVTGSSGHLGEALVRTLRADGHDPIGLDLLASPTTDVVGSLGDRSTVRRALDGVGAVLHTATLHQPHARSAARQAFVDTNVTGTLVLLEQALAEGVDRFVFTSTTSTFGRALMPEDGAPAAWITEDTVPVPRNIYGVTKVAAENVCELIHGDSGLPIVILRTSRFFPEPDDDPEISSRFSNANVQANEILYRRVDLADVVQAHQCALDSAPEIGFGRYIVSATTPFTPADLVELRSAAPDVVRRLYPDYESRYAERGWEMFPGINRVYDNARARAELGWVPSYDFARLLKSLAHGVDPRSPLAVAVGSKGYR